MRSVNKTGFPISFLDFYTILKSRALYCCARGHNFVQMRKIIDGLDCFLLSKNRVKIFFKSLGANCDCQILATLMPYLNPGLQTYWNQCFDCERLYNPVLRANEPILVESGKLDRDLEVIFQWVMNRKGTEVNCSLV